MTEAAAVRQSAMPSAHQWVDGQQREGKAQQQGEDDDDNVEAAATGGSSRVEPVEHNADEGEGAHIAANSEAQEAIQEPAGRGAAICTRSSTLQALPIMAAGDLTQGCFGLTGHQQYGHSSNTVLAIGHALTCLPLCPSSGFRTSQIQHQCRACCVCETRPRSGLSGDMLSSTLLCSLHVEVVIFMCHSLHNVCMS